MNDLVTGMLPILGRSLAAEFNVFDVMHHGLHEKQLSNVFRWLLAEEGTHGLGAAFTGIFIDEVNRARPLDAPLAGQGYSVSQEVATSLPGEPGDVADLMLEGADAVVIIENYYTSSGHGHGYDRYLQHARKDGKRGEVVLLCRDVDRSLLTQDWERAAVVTYRALVDRLHEVVRANLEYQRTHPAAFSFLQQLHRKFSKGFEQLSGNDILKFVTAMCDTGEAHRYGATKQQVQAQQFANDLAEQARERFGEGRAFLQTVKTRLRSYGEQVLAPQLVQSLGERTTIAVAANYSGIYQWSVNFELSEPASDSVLRRFQVKLGPSAWFAVEKDDNWTFASNEAAPDYSHLFLTFKHSGEIRQSDVALSEVLAGLEPSDRRLHDEVLEHLVARQ